MSYRKKYQESWRDLIIEIAKFLIEEMETLGFEIYKFLGNGWILLFNNEFPPQDFFPFINKLEAKYADEYNKSINKLCTGIDKIGIKFGFEIGQLDRFQMLKTQEYIGMPIIMAERLQGAIEDGDQNPQGKLLMSGAVYHKVKRYIPRDHKLWDVPRKLKDVMGEKEYHYIKYEKRLK